MAKELYNFTREEILKEAYKSRVIDLGKPSDLARLTAALMLRNPEKLSEIKFMVSLLNKIYNKLPQDKRPALPHESMKVSGADNAKILDNPSKPLCGTTPDGKKFCVSPAEPGKSNSNNGTGQSTWSVIKNNSGQLFVKIGPIVVGVLVFCAFLFGGWMIGLSAVVLASMIFPDSTKAVIKKVADVLGFVLKQAGRAAKIAADAVGLTNIFIFGGLAFAAFILIQAKE